MKSEHITELEHNGDTITHDIVNLLHKTFVTPIEREDIALLARAHGRRDGLHRGREHGDAHL